MDHNEASRLMASEKYLLDELSPTEMEAFEEHLFACNECALDVRAGSLLLEHGKVELANPTPRVVPAEVRPSRGFVWWWPSFAVPAMAILLVVVGYQNLVTLPAMRGALAEDRMPKILPAASLVSSVVRGSTPSVISARRGKQFFLPVDIQAQSAFESYVVELQNPAGGVQWSLPVSSESAKNTLPIGAPGVNEAGHYEVVVLGRNAQGKDSEIARYPFELQFAGAANPEAK
jgi:hypothetical protein